MPLPPQRSQSTKKDSRGSRNASFSRTPTIKSNATVTLYHPEQPAASVAEFRPPVTPVTTNSILGTASAIGGGGGGSGSAVGLGFTASVSVEEPRFEFCGDGEGGAPSQGLGQGSMPSIVGDPPSAEGVGEPEIGRYRGAKRLTLDAPIEEWRSRSSSRTSRDFRAALSEEDANEVFSPYNITK